MDRRAFFEWSRRADEHTVTEASRPPTQAEIMRWYIDDYVPELIATQNVTTEKADRIASPQSSFSDCGSFFGGMDDCRQGCPGVDTWAIDTAAENHHKIQHAQ